MIVDSELTMFSDPVNPRALPIMGQVVGPTTVESCVAACNNQGYTIAGLEYGFQCCTSICRALARFLALCTDNR